MVDEVKIIREEVVPRLESIGAYRVVELIEESRDLRYLASQAASDEITGEGYFTMWEPLDTVLPGIGLDLLVPTHVIVPEETGDLSPEELDEHAVGVIDIVSKHVELRDSGLEDDLREIASHWETVSGLDRLFLFPKYPLDVSEVTFTVREDYQVHRTREELSYTGETIQRLRELFESAEARIPDQLRSIYAPRDFLYLVLVCLGEKRGTSMHGRIPSDGFLDDLLSLLEGMGVECAVKRTRFDEFPDYIFLYASNTRFEDYRTLFQHDAGETGERVAGEFYGYPDDVVDAFVSGETDTGPSDGRFSFETLNVADRHGVSGDELRRLYVFISYLIPDDVSFLEDALSTADDRYRALERLRDEEGVDLMDIYEEIQPIRFDD